MELLAFGGDSLVWNPRHRVSIHAVPSNCKSFGEIIFRLPWNVRGVSVVGKRKVVQARGHNVRVGYISASETMNERDRVMITGNENPRNVSSLAKEGDVVDRDTPQAGEMLITPRQTGRVRGLRAARRSFDEEDYATANLLHSQQKPAVNMRAQAPSALTSIALAAIPLLLIAPVIGFIARCMVDYIRVHIEQEVSKRFAEMESWQARRRPRVKRRWQTILEEDRDEDVLDEPSTSSAIPEYQYESDPWSMNARQPIAGGTTESDSWNEKEIEEERKLRQRYDYEQIKRSYTRLEPMYEKFLADSGLSSSSNWRGASES